MNSLLRRFVGGSLLLGLALSLSIPSSEGILIAQKKGGGKRDPDAKEKKKELAPPPNVDLPESWVKSFQWRCVGPANMGGRITSIAVCESDPTTYWVATASGGLVKTTNNGVSFVHQFDKEGTVSIGDVCVAPSNKNIAWVGTGENNPRNSVSWGDGVYKSTDGGQNWKNMGLKKTFQIGKILVHPTNPDIVYVGALGRLYGPNPDRGLYKTTDGGMSWEKIFFIDESTGIIDMRMHPTQPDTIWIATWERQRDGFDSWPGGRDAGVPDGYDLYDPVKKWGKGSGIWKTVDGGRNFTRLTKGLPTNNMGRIGLNVYLKNPNTLFAIVDCEKIGMGTPPKKDAAAARTIYMGINGEDVGDDKGVKFTSITPNGPADKAGLKIDDVVTKIAGKEAKNYENFLEIAREHKPGDKVKFDVVRGEEKLTVELTFGERPEAKLGGGKGGGPPAGGPGGPTATRPYHANYGGQTPNVQQKQGPDSHEYGGVYKSTDGGESWTRINSVNPRPMYFSQIRVDPTDEKNLYVLGVRLYRSNDGGKTFNQMNPLIHADQHAMWINPKDGRHAIIGTDGGFYVTYDRTATWLHHNQMAMGQFYHVAVCNKKPYWIYGGLQDNGTWGFPSANARNGAMINEDVINIFGGDGYVCRVDPNDSDQIYYEMQNGGMGRLHLKTGERKGLKPAFAINNRQYRFNWNTPFILSSHNSNIWYAGSNFIFRSVKKGDDPKVISPEITRTRNGSATAISESPLNPDVLWAGTDDGYLWLTKNGGKDWVSLTEKLKFAKPYWVATIEASRFKEGMAYVAFDGHRLDDDDPHVFVTEDFGETWKSLRANLPAGSSRCLREDAINPNVLYLGTEFAVYVSINRGRSWTKLNNNLPTVAVHEIAVHPTAGEIVAATHGRSCWIFDVTALRQMANEAIKDKPILYKPNTVTRPDNGPGRARNANRFAGTNPIPGAMIFYSLPKKPAKATMQVFDIDGTKVTDVAINPNAGLNRANWNLFGNNRPAPPGSYRVVLNVDGQVLSQSFKVEGEASPAQGRGAEEEEEEDDEGDDWNDK